MTIYGEEVIRWVRERAPGVDFGEARAIGWEAGGRLVAGAVYHDWNPQKGAIEISVAGEGAWMTRTRAREMLDYPFGFCRLVYGKTENAAVRRAWKRLGGTEYEIPGLWTVLWLTREQWWRHRP